MYYVSAGTTVDVEVADNGNYVLMPVTLAGAGQKHCNSASVKADGITATITQSYNVYAVSEVKYDSGVTATYVRNGVDQPVSGGQYVALDTVLKVAKGSTGTGVIAYYGSVDSVYGDNLVETGYKVTEKNVVLYPAWKVTAGEGITMKIADGTNTAVAAGDVENGTTYVASHNYISVTLDADAADHVIDVTNGLSDTTEITVAGTQVTSDLNLACAVKVNADNNLKVEYYSDAVKTYVEADLDGSEDCFIKTDVDVRVTASDTSKTVTMTGADVEDINFKSTGNVATFTTNVEDLTLAQSV